MDTAAETPAPGSPSLGNTLAAERARLGWSRADVAQRLHMSPSQVEALETGEYGRLPKGTFLRGFVRNYAKALGVDAEPLLALLAQGRPHEAAPGIVVPTQNIRFDPLGERFSSPYVRAGIAAVVMIALGFAAMYWWTFVRPTPPATLVKKPPEAVALAPVTPAAVPEPGPASKAEPAAEPPKPEPARAETAKPEAAKAQVAKAEPAKPGGEPAKAEAAKPKPEAAKAPAPAAPRPAAPALAQAPAAAAGSTPAPEASSAALDGKTLHFTFKGPSWVEVRDARDHIVFQRLNPAGSVADVPTSRFLPLSIVVGNAPEVEMTYGGRPYPLEPHTKVAVARFTLD